MSDKTLQHLRLPKLRVRVDAYAHVVRALLKLRVGAQSEILGPLKEWQHVVADQALQLLRDDVGLDDVEEVRVVGHNGSGLVDAVQVLRPEDVAQATLTLFA